MCFNAMARAMRHTTTNTMSDAYPWGMSGDPPHQGGHVGGLQVTDLFGEPFVYGAHEIWPYAQVQHIENTVLTRAAKLLATFLDKETAREFVEEERKSSDDAEPTAKSGESQ